MPDVTLEVKGIKGERDREKLERAVGRLGFVSEVNADAGRGLLAVSYSGGKEELHAIGEAVEQAGYAHGLSPGARRIEEK